MKPIFTTISKILVLGGLIIVAWVLLGTIRGWEGESSDGFQVRPLSQGFSLTDGQTQPNFDNALAKYPEPEKFTRVKAGQPRLDLSGACKDTYVTVLIFERGVDYRRQPEMAKFNRAFDCPRGGLFWQTIDVENLGLKDVDHYVIMADQGEQNFWYNPR